MNYMPRRNNVISWDNYFMGVASLAAKRSKDPYTQVGACIVSNDRKILSTGYNGAPNGYSDDLINWNREGDFLNTKYAYICHAELNAILNNNGLDLKGATIYVDLFPCNECAKAIIQCGIKEVVYKSDKYHNKDMYKVSKQLFDTCGIKYRQYKKENKKLVIDL